MKELLTQVSPVGQDVTYFATDTGFRFTTVANPEPITALGRLVRDGNTGSRMMKIIREDDPNRVPVASVSVSLDGVSVGQTAWENLSLPYQPDPSTGYLVVSDEGSAPAQKEAETTQHTITGGFCTRVSARYWTGTNWGHSATQNPDGNVYGGVNIRFGTAGPPSAPTLAVTANNASQITVSWSDVASETKYVVERKAWYSDLGHQDDLHDYFQVLGEIAAGSTSYVDTDVQPGLDLPYSYRVKACNGALCSAYSNETKSSALPDSTGAPAAPTGATATLRADNTVSVSWADNSSGATTEYEFEVERCEDAGCSNFFRVGAGGWNWIYFWDRSARPSKTYKYRVRAKNATNSKERTTYAYSSYSTTSEVTTSAAGSPTLAWRVNPPATARVGEVVVFDARASTNVEWRPQASGARSVGMDFDDSSYVCEALACGHAFTSAGTFNVVVSGKNQSGVAATNLQHTIMVSAIPAAGGGTTITDSCLAGGTGNNVQTLVDKGTAADNKTCLQNAVTRALGRQNAGEQEIVLPAGAVYDGPIDVDAASGSAGNFWLTIRSSALASMPAGRRVSSADAGNMPTIQARSDVALTEVGLRIAPNASNLPVHHIRVQGVRIKKKVANAGGSEDVQQVLAQVGSTSYNSYAGRGERNVFTELGERNDFADLAGTAELNAPHHVILDRLYVDGGTGATDYTRVGVRITGNSVTVIDSMAENMKVPRPPDSQAIINGQGQGLAVINTKMVATSECYQVGYGSPINRQVATLTSATRESATFSNTSNLFVGQTVAFQYKGYWYPWMATVIRTINTGTGAATFDPVPLVPTATDLASWVEQPGLLEFYHNHVTKPETWWFGPPESTTHGSSYAGNNYEVKNLFESKGVEFASIVGNVFENFWEEDQAHALTFTPKYFTGTESEAIGVRHVQVSENYFHKIATLFSITPWGAGPGSATSGTLNITLRDNLTRRLGSSYDNLPSGSIRQFANPQASLTWRFLKHQSLHIVNNTVDFGPSNQGWFIADVNGIGPFSAEGGAWDAVWLNNMMHSGHSAAVGTTGTLRWNYSPTTDFVPILETAYGPATTTIWNNNLIAESHSSYNYGGHAGVILPSGATSWSGQFVGYVTGDFTVASGTSGKSAGDDDRDLGVNFAALRARIGAGSVNLDSATIKVVSGDWSAAPLSWVQSISGSAPANYHHGKIGTKFTVGPSDVTVTALGRLVVAGNTGSHTVRIIHADTNEEVASVPVSTAGAVAGTFAYADLTSSATLLAGNHYYLMSDEVSGGDQWYQGTTFTTSSVATITNSAYESSPGTYILGGSPGMWVGLNFKYLGSP